ncbi:MAG: aspartate carbamoyltransferase [Candidatus Peregrinibacteria bacterium]|nr:aspartate carbamoyltransferase [Candidatus Peregrinibacteria bacterium]MDZ4245303.1 aspartate carbamoyltransferase [Candidatus Gracilibacteria bacterium]
MEFKGADILSTKQFSREDLEKIMEVARGMERYAFKEQTSDLLKGYVMASLFYEPSTRTRLSFETAMKRLGGDVVTAVGMQFSSLYKGETVHDTGKTIENYVDVIAMRHPDQGSVDEMANAASVPVLNAGDGPGQHPTQALLDLYTIFEEKGKVDGLTIAMSGDLKYGRTVHSLCYLLGHYNVKMIFISPDELRMPEKVTSYLDEHNVSYEETEDFDGVIAAGVDVLYCTRIQRERFLDNAEYERLKSVFILDKAKAMTGKSDMTIMHPLPRVGEIKEDTDELPGAAYFRQARNGVTVRMALLAMVLGRA